MYPYLTMPDFLFIDIVGSINTKGYENMVLLNINRCLPILSKLIIINLT